MTDIGVGDLDDDGEVEFVWGGGATSSGEDTLTIAGSNPVPNVEWTNLMPSQLDGPFVGGALLGNISNMPAPLFATPRTDSGYSGTRLVRMDPVSGDLALSEELGTNWNRVAVVDVADYDNDLTDEVFLGTSALYDGYFTVYDFLGETTEWTSPVGDNGEMVGAAVTSGDLNGDGRDDFVVMSTAGIVYAYDVFQQTLIWQSTTHAGGGTDVVLADLDGDAALEIIATTRDGVFVYSENDAGLPAYVQTGVNTSMPVGSQIRAVKVADTDGDGSEELLILSSATFTSNSPARVIRLDASLSVLSQFESPWPAVDVLIESSLGSRRNLILVSSSDAVQRSRFIAHDPITGVEVWRSPLLLGGPVKASLHYVDVDNDGDPEFSFGTQYGMFLTR